MPESNLPAVIEHREAAVEAQSRGDPGAADESFALELDALRGEPVGAPAVPALRFPDVTAAAAETALARLGEFDPDGTAALRQSWGIETASNLAAGDWIADRYLPAGIEGITPDAGLFRIGAALGRGIYADMTGGIDIGSVAPASEDLVRDFFDVVNEDNDRAAWHAWRSRIGDSAMRSGLASVRRLMGRYAVSGADLPDGLPFWRMAIEAAPKIINDLRQAATTRTRTPEGTTSMDDDEADFNDVLEAHRAKIVAAQARGDSKQASRLYVAEQQMIAAHKGNRPIVGAGQRYA